MENRLNSKIMLKINSTVHFSFDKASLWQVNFFEKFVQCRVEKFDLIFCCIKGSLVV